MSDNTLLKPHTKDIGGFEVRRILPAHPNKMVGPFIFFDHIGPAQLPAGSGLDVRPHPHIGLATVTYLFDGAILHRDSLGSVQRIEPGAVTWMTAGEGIAHSERTPDEERAAGPRLHGIQVWVALPQMHERTAPRFNHYPRNEIPAITLPGVNMRLIAGAAYGRSAPAPTYSPTFYLAVEMEAGATFELPDEYDQRAIYLVSGEVTVGDSALPLHHMAVASARGSVRVVSRTPSRLMLIGGDALDGERDIWWNFVASSSAMIDEAAERWRKGEFPPVPGETEFIPLPPARGPRVTFLP